MTWHVLYLVYVTWNRPLDWPEQLRAEPGEHSRPVLVRKGVSAPSTVVAAVALPELGVAVALTVRVDVGGTVRVAELSVHARETPTTAAITVRALRSIKLDALAREAVRQCESPVIMREDVMPGAFQLPGDDPNVLWVPGGGRVPGRPHTPREQAERAAKLYTEAVASGSRAPTQAVAAELFCSRSHASRLIRSARDLGLLANPGAPTTTPSEAPTAPITDQKPEPGPSIFRDPNEPWPWGTNEGSKGANDQDD